MNPDNLATPLAASIGDVVSLSILSFSASLLFDHIGEYCGSLTPENQPVDELF